MQQLKCMHARLPCDLQCSIETRVGMLRECKLLLADKAEAIARASVEHKGLYASGLGEEL